MSDIRVDHVKLIRAQVFGRGVIRRPAKELGKVPDRSDVRFQGTLSEPFGPHILNHTRMQWAYLLL